MVIQITSSIGEMLAGAATPQTSYLSIAQEQIADVILVPDIRHNVCRLLTMKTQGNPSHTEKERFDKTLRKMFTISEEEVQRREVAWRESKDIKAQPGRAPRKG